MLRRKIEKELLKWKKKEDKKPLLVCGARQIGKTFIIDKFAKENYDNYIYINFVEKSEYIDVFDGNLDVESVIQKLMLKNSNFNFVENKTLIFFDEIQMCGNARTALKFFSIDGRYDVIGSGSLLGINYNDVTSFPVGYNERINMYPLDFEEFLWANNVDEKIIDVLREHKKNYETLDKVYHDEMMNYFKKYIVLGGMPEVINTYIETKSFIEAEEVKSRIILDYKDDILKYAQKNEKSKIKDVFNAIPRMLMKEYKKFTYNDVKDKGTYAKYQNSIMWLCDAGVINICHNLSRAEMPLNGFVKDNEFKLYMKDTGLLVTMLGKEVYKSILNDEMQIYKGAIYENVVAEILDNIGYELYYFNRRNTLEIDFVIENNNEINLIEVKSADNTKSKSLSTLIFENDNLKGIKLSSKNIGKTEKIETIPIYMAFLLKE